MSEREGRGGGGKVEEREGGRRGYQRDNFIYITFCYIACDPQYDC